VVCIVEGMNPCLPVLSFDRQPAGFTPICCPVEKGPQAARFLWPANFNAVRGKLTYGQGMGI